MPDVTPYFLDDPAIENPFADFSIKEVVNNIQSHLKINSEPYTCLSLQEKNISSGTQTKQESCRYEDNYNIAKCDKKTAELIRKYEELKKKEQELLQREQVLKRENQNGRRNNWPPLPGMCCFQPCFYQDIEVDIPLEFQKLVKSLYYLWIFHLMVLAVNLIGGIILKDFNLIGQGLFYLSLFPALGYICWFRPAYKAFRSDSSFNFLVFFFMYFFQLIISWIHAIGATGCGTIGIVTAILIVQTPQVYVSGKIISPIIATGFVIAATADLYMITKIHRIYKSTGASLEKAQHEFSCEFLQAEHVQSAVGNTITIQFHKK